MLVCVLLVLLCTSSLVTLASSEAIKCEEDCLCETADGRVLDLSAITKVSGIEEDKKQKYQFLFQPCQPLRSVEGCEDSNVCQESIDHRQTYKLGGGVESTSGDVDKGFYVNYKTQQSERVFRQSVVQIICFELPMLKFVNQTEGGGENATDPIIYTLHYYGPGGCLLDKPKDKKISAGSVLLILFFVGLLVYFIGGILLNKFVRGAVGPEVLPNYAFWSDFPALLKDGWVFAITCGCCRQDEQSQGYDNI